MRVRAVFGVIALVAASVPVGVATAQGDVVGNASSETTIGYGKATDTLLVGDWDGNHVDTFAVKRSE